MMTKLIVFAAVAALGGYPVHSQRPAASAVREIKAGEVVALGESLTVKITKAAVSPFAGVKVKGEPLVVVIELDAGKKGVAFLYNLSADSRSSELYLASGGQRLAPRALVEDFPSLGSDNDKEVEVLDPKDGVGASTIEFESKGYISVLFDLPTSQAKTPKKFSATLRTTRPTQERLALMVSL